MRDVLPINAKLVPQEAKLVFKGIIYDTYQWEQEMFDGSHQTFEMLKRPDTVKILAVKDGKVVVLEQEQPGHEAFFDLPGGRHDIESESELDAAKREMAEETGLTFKAWKLLDVTQPHTKIEQFVYIFLATDFEKQVETHLDVGEKITVQYLDFDTFKQLVSNPKARYLPKELLEKVNSIDELFALPEYK